MVYFWKRKKKSLVLYTNPKHFCLFIFGSEEVFGAPGWDEAWAPFKYKPNSKEGYGAAGWDEA